MPVDPSSHEVRLYGHHSRVPADHPHTELRMRLLLLLLLHEVRLVDGAVGAARVAAPGLMLLLLLLSASDRMVDGGIGVDAAPRWVRRAAKVEQ